MDKAVLALEGDTRQNCRHKLVQEPFFVTVFQKVTGLQPNCPVTAASKNTEDKNPSSRNKQALSKSCSQEMETDLFENSLEIAQLYYPFLLITTHVNMVTLYEFQLALPSM